MKIKAEGGRRLGSFSVALVSRPPAANGEDKPDAMSSPCDAAEDLQSQEKKVVKPSSSGNSSSTSASSSSSSDSDSSKSQKDSLALTDTAVSKGDIANSLPLAQASDEKPEDTKEDSQEPEDKSGEDIVREVLHGLIGRPTGEAGVPDTEDAQEDSGSDAAIQQTSTSKEAAGPETPSVEKASEEVGSGAPADKANEEKGPETPTMDVAKEEVDVPDSKQTVTKSEAAAEDAVSKPSGASVPDINKNKRKKGLSLVVNPAAKLPQDGKKDAKKPKVAPKSDEKKKPDTAPAAAPKEASEKKNKKKPDSKGVKEGSGKTAAKAAADSEKQKKGIDEKKDTPKVVDAVSEGVDDKIGQRIEMLPGKEEPPKDEMAAPVEKGRQETGSAATDVTEKSKPSGKKAKEKPDPAADPKESDKKAQGSSKKKAKSSEKEAPASRKRALSAYNIFCMENRKKVKLELGEDAKATTIMERLAHEWNACSGRTEYEKKAADDKEAVKKLAETSPSGADPPAAASGEYEKKDADEKEAVKKPAENSPSGADPPAAASGKTKSKTGKAAKEKKEPRARSAYQFFCLDNRARVQDELGPAASFGATMKLLAKEWETLSDKKIYNEKAAAEKAKFAAEKAAKEPVKPSVPKTQAKTKNPAVPAEETISLADVAGIETSQEEGDIQFVLARTRGGEYIVKRQGMDYTQVTYESLNGTKDGKPEAEEDPEEKELRVAVAKFQARQAAFRKEIKERSNDNEKALDLDDLPVGNPLEMLSFLGMIREDVFPPANVKPAYPDVWMKVPMLGLCQIVQHLIAGEREHQTELRKELDSANRRIKELEGSKSKIAKATVEE